MVRMLIPDPRDLLTLLPRLTGLLGEVEALVARIEVTRRSADALVARIGTTEASDRLGLGAGAGVAIRAVSYRSSTTGVAAGSAAVARLLFGLFLIIFIVLLIVGLIGGTLVF